MREPKIVESDREFQRISENLLLKIWLFYTQFSNKILHLSHLYSYHLRFIFLSLTILYSQRFYNLFIRFHNPKDLDFFVNPENFGILENSKGILEFWKFLFAASLTTANRHINFCNFHPSDHPFSVFSVSNDQFLLIDFFLTTLYNKAARVARDTEYARFGIRTYDVVERIQAESRGERANAEREIYEPASENALTNQQRPKRSREAASLFSA